VACPAQLLQSIAQNLLSNAVKYSAGKPDAKVTVRVARERGEAVLEVTDNGIGMSEESQRRLFQPFFRAPEARALPGHGLGMATTKRLIEAHGGTIAVRSALHAGTQVTVKFALASAPEQNISPLPASASDQATAMAG
jgi:signal transduction histidine kinase